MFRFKTLLLTAAASQAKQDALAKKYKLEAQVVEKLSNIDPTPNGEYTDWLCREASRTHLPGAHQLSEITGYLSEYVKLKRNPQWKGEKNILNLAYDAFKTQMEAASREDYSKKQKVRDIEENAKKYISDGVKYLGKVEGAYCYQVLTAVASAAMSAGTHWCTQNEETSNAYLSDGSIYVFTRDGSNNDYGNDKYAQIYVSRNKIEGELSNGTDITSNSTWGMIYNEETFKFMQFLGQFNELVKEGLANEKIHMSDEDIEKCADCGDPIEEGDGYYGGNAVYCESCYRDHYSSCSHCGAEIDIDGGAYVSTNDGDLCDDCGKYCTACSEGYLTKGRRATAFHEVKDYRGNEIEICDNCFNEDYFNCSNCNENFEIGNRKEYNGDDVCSDCFDKEWIDDTYRTLDAWVSSEELEEIISKEVVEAAQKLFEGKKLALVQPYFEKMKKDGYLYSWEDLDLTTSLQFIPEGQELVLDELRKMVTNPVLFILEKLTEAIKEDADPDTSWDEGDIIDWLEKEGIVDGDKYQNNLVETLGV